MEQDPYTELTEEIAGEQTEVKEKEPKQKIQLDKEEISKDQTSDVITEEDAKRIGLSKTFVGKPYKETMEEVYRNSVSWDNKLSQQLAEMTRKMGEFEVKLSQTEIKETQEEVEEKLPDISDYIDEDGFVTDRKGLDAYLIKREDRLMKAFEKKLEEKNAPIAENTKNLMVQQFQTELYDNIADQLSEIYEDEITPDIVQKLLDDYGDFLKGEDKETQAQYHLLYRGKPAKLARDIVTYHKANRKPQKTQTDAEKQAEEAHKKQLEKLKKQEKTFVKSASSGREIKEEVAKEDKDYLDLINESLDSQDAQERFAETK